MYRHRLHHMIAVMGARIHVDCISRIAHKLDTPVLIIIDDDGNPEGKLKEKLQNLESIELQIAITRNLPLIYEGSPESSVRQILLPVPTTPCVYVEVEASHVCPKKIPLIKTRPPPREAFLFCVFPVFLSCLSSPPPSTLHLLLKKEYH